MSAGPFDINPEVAAMKEDVARRVFRLKTIQGLITLGTLAVAAVAAFTILPALAAGGAGLGAALGQAAIPLALAAAGGLGSYVTMKERKRLEIDEEFLQSRMQGRNWWTGYRQEVMQQNGAAEEPIHASSGFPSKHMTGKQR